MCFIGCLLILAERVYASALTSDAGWGCSVRAVQSLLVECLIARVLGDVRDLTPLNSETMKIVNMFADRPSAPLSLHRFIEEGQKMLPRENSLWFGPTSAAQVFAKIAEPSLLGGVGVLCFPDGTVYADQVAKEFEGSPGGVILLISRKLGSEAQIDVERYKTAILNLFLIPYFRGIAGGETTTAAYYFPAACDDGLYYLDPHRLVQPALTEDEPGSLTQERVLRMSWTRLNPSITFGFFLQSPEIFKQLMTSIDSKLAEFADTQPNYKGLDFVSLSDDDHDWAYAVKEEEGPQGVF